MTQAASDIHITEPPRRKRQNSENGVLPREYNEQAALFQFLRTFAGRYPVLGTIFAIPNGLALAPKTARMAKAQGVLSGTWDICVPVCGCTFPTPTDKTYPITHTLLFIEMKVGKNTLTNPQAEFKRMLLQAAEKIDLLRPAFIVCYSWIEAARTIVEYLGIEDERIERVIAPSAQPHPPPPSPKKRRGEMHCCSLPPLLAKNERAGEGQG